jgi:hypothetical protein
VNTVTWKRNRELERWEAYVDGERVAHASVREGTPTGYWGRYEGRIRGQKGHVYATTLTEFKQLTTTAHAARQAAS